MGGKTKQSQRTKNNARPSSSSRSAELLSNAVTLDGNVVTLAGGKVLPALFPSLAATTLDQGLSPEFQMSIKKLNKKDPITRAKALQELSELVSNSNVDDVVALLPIWTHNYKTLTTDTDRKVREMTQLCHSMIVKTCGRRVAPQLKALVPVWLQAQYDEHAPAQTHAQNSLTSTFPDNKLPEVISFCKAEVMAHFLDNLIGNAEAVINKRVENAEERALQWSRVVCSSLQGLQSLLQRLPAAHDTWLWQELQPLLKSNNFWKFSTHSDPQVRAAWYGAVGRLVQRYGDTYGSECGVRTVRVMLGAKEQHALVAAQLWASVLLLMHHVQDWHTYLDKQELLIKRILDVLEAGGWGDAKHLTNLLLPLLANLPHDIKTKDFYDKFFAAIFVGLNKKNILNSKSERQYWITSLAECLRYLSVQQTDYVVEIATGVHRTWLENVLNTEHDTQIRTNLIKTSATNMTSLVKYWLKQSKEESAEKYDQLIRNFWQNVGTTVLNQIDRCGTDAAEIGKLIDGHILLLQNLKSMFLQDAKKQQSIKFDDDKNVTPDENVTVVSQCDETIVERYKHNLNELVNSVCAHYVETAATKQISSAILTPLITLLVEFDSLNLFMTLARQFGVGSVYELYDKVLRTWLSGDTMRCKAVIDVVFQAMKYMSEEEQDAMFHSFQQFPPVCVEWSVSRVARHPLVCLAPAQRWLRSTVCAHAAAALARRAVHGDVTAADLLLLCLADAPDGECLLNSSAVSEVVNTVSNALSSSNITLEYSASLAARLVTALVERASLHCVPLLRKLFQLTIVVPRGDSRLSLDTWCEVRSSWQDGVAALSKEHRIQFHKDAASFLHQQLFDTIDELNVTRIEHMVSLCPYLFELSNDDDVTEIVTFTKLIFAMYDIESQLVETAALRHLCVTSKLNCLYNDNDVIKNIIDESGSVNIKELSKMDLLPYINRFLFRAIHLRTLLLHKGCEEDESSWCDPLLKDKYLLEEFCKVIYNYVIVHTLHEAYAFWPHYEIIVQTKQKLDSLLESVLSKTSLDARAQVSSILSQHAAASGYFWCIAHQYYLANQGGVHDIDTKKMQLGDSANGYFHSFQAATKWCSQPQLTLDTKLMVAVRSWHATYGSLLDQHKLEQLVQGDTHSAIDLIIDCYYKHNETMLYEKDVSGSSWSSVVSVVCVVEYLTAAVQQRGWELHHTAWDFTTITLCSLLTSVLHSSKAWKSTKVSMLTHSVLRLFRAVRTFVSSIRSECERREPLPHVVDLMSEWKDMFAPETHYSLITFMVHVLDKSGSTITSNEIPVLGELVSCCSELSWDSLPAAHKVSALSLARLARCAGAALRRVTQPQYKYLAHRLLLALGKPLVLDDVERLTLWSEQSSAEDEEREKEKEKERPPLALSAFHKTFMDLADLVMCAVTEEQCEVAVQSDSYSVTLGFLLLVDVLENLCVLARGDLHQHYVQYFRTHKYGEYTIQLSLRLLPAPVYSWAADSTGGAARPAAADDMFRAMPTFSVYEYPGSGLISASACRATYICVCGAGCGAVRAWWSAASPRTARLLDKLVAAYVAPHAVRQQLADLHTRAGEIDDTEIRISWSSNEVSCIYNVEERGIELSVSLSRTHPLRPPRLAAPPPSTSLHWVTLYLAYQNGTLLNAIKMWTQAVSARVESFPQCYICYCRMHPSNGQLPRVNCHQCKNKFHNTCLRKWFMTSNKSNCPLCRGNF